MLPEEQEERYIYAAARPSDYRFHACKVTRVRGSSPPRTQVTPFLAPRAEKLS
jgi:hypothetical protein